jgi:hypothetical protein
MKCFVALLGFAVVLSGGQQKETDEVTAAVRKALREKKIVVLEWPKTSKIVVLQWPMTGPGGTGKTPIGVGSGSPLYIDLPDGNAFDASSGNLLAPFTDYYGLTVSVHYKLSGTPTSDSYGCWANALNANALNCVVVMTTNYQPGGHGAPYATLTFTATARNLIFQWNDGNGGTSFNAWKQFGKHAWVLDPAVAPNVAITAITINAQGTSASTTCPCSLMIDSGQQP